MLAEKNLTKKEGEEMSLKKLCEQDREWIVSVLGRSLTRFPELESFDEDEWRRFFIYWDDVFVRWLQRTYRANGIEVEHEPDNPTLRITFHRLPTNFQYPLELPKALGPCEVSPDQARTVLEIAGRKGLVNYYLEKRLSDLSG